MNRNKEKIPTKDDWLPITSKSKLDEGEAYRNFYAKSFKEALELFTKNAFYYQEDLSYMPEVPLRFYLGACIGYLFSEDSREDSDAASCFLGLIEYKIEYEWENFKEIYPSVMECMEFIANNQKRFDADVNIYGLFSHRVEKIKYLAKEEGIR